MVRHLLLTLEAEIIGVSWREVRVSVIARSMDEVVRAVQMALREQGVVRAVEKLRLLVWDTNISTFVPLDALHKIDASCSARVKVEIDTSILKPQELEKRGPTSSDLRLHELRQAAAANQMRRGKDVDEEDSFAHQNMMRAPNYHMFCCCFVCCWKEHLHVGDVEDSGSLATFKKDLAKQRKAWGPDPYYDENGKMIYNHHFAGDALHYILNEHPVIGMCFAHKLHPFSKMERVIVVLATLGFSFFSSTIVEEGSYNMSTLYALGVSAVGYCLKEVSMIEVKLVRVKFVRIHGERLAQCLVVLMLGMAAILAWQGLENILNDFGTCAQVSSRYKFNQTGFGFERSSVDGRGRVCPPAAVTLCNSSFVTFAAFREHPILTDKFVRMHGAHGALGETDEYVTRNSSFWLQLVGEVSASSFSFSVPVAGDESELGASATCASNGCTECFTPGDINEVMYVFAMQQAQSWIVIWPLLSGASFIVAHHIELRRKAYDSRKVIPSGDTPGEGGGEGPEESPRTKTWASPVKAELDDDRIVPIGAVLYGDVETKSVQRLTMSF
jgi:hypothetical protein